ncbi:MFS transporter [Cellulomonas aerilata]|uniref:MFS transporter n=1 Tax=Cellulomonas aerilata TaxID=515326 RepID=A0A512DFM3_9CELL|nr:MFS transporter [Cellulomonas aerilata]GEO35010.1 MFS transporter [Cellulomonas aerilata]
MSHESGVPSAVPASPAVPAAPAPLRGHVAAWALWDWGSAAFNAVVTTFVFTRWLTSDAFADPATVAAAAREGDAGGPATAALDAVLAQHSAWLGWGLTVAGLLIALLAPVIGARSDDAGRRRRWLAVHTAVTVVICAAMFLVRPDPGSLTENLLLGIVLLSVGNVFFELAGVNYNGMLSQVSTPATRGRVSGLGWGAGYLGGIVLLLILFVGFINPDVGWFGVTGEDGLDVRLSVLLSAVWFAVFAVPVLLAVPEAPPHPRRARTGIVASYRRLFADIAALWRERRPTLWFLLASAVYRDGLAGVFTFGAVIASGTFGFSASGVVLFAIVANVVAGVSTIVAGHLDDRVGPKAIIVTALVGLLVAGTAVFFLHDGGQGVFWVFGLMLCVFVGPAQSCSRSLLSRVIPPGRESEVFGLYATTGRAASFLAPLAFSTFVVVSGSQHWGIVGLMLVLALGLALLLPIRVAGRAPAEATP